MFQTVPARKNNKDSSVDEFFEDNFFSSALMNTPFSVDVKETDDSYLLEADLPGVKIETIELDYENNYLTIRAKRDDTMEDKQDNYIRRERKYGEFRRSFYIDDVEEDKIDASFNDGVLKLTLPKQ
ncbi:Hsp20/alpha crystallin family protein [Clostridium ganghwense]|uniref:Hsp20/alpha crystallin family protein n=1 Tax=Clostridium ganghwense TaxID=312089 RepID=A0ABT4CT33_9CLOT|nr:Hsp20/alpha crystallin family protein [Clostridium ganghwense]MCY6372240.1 Hsp20/alpha crystallin family protein [Clostridium ganghwense]